MHCFNLLIVLGCITTTGNLYAQPATDAAGAGSTQQAQPQERIPPVRQDSLQPATPTRYSARLLQTTRTGMGSTAILGLILVSSAWSVQ